MSIIAEEKIKISNEILNAADNIQKNRVKSSDILELSEDMANTLADGLIIDYHKNALLYGKQRSILKGLSDTDVMHFDINEASEYDDFGSFTMPTTEQFGYEVFDNNGNIINITIASELYLAKSKNNNQLATSAKSKLLPYYTNDDPINGTLLGLDKWNLEFEQVDFTISSSTYSSDIYTLKLINIIADVINAAPNILDEYILRYKTDHTKFGTLKVLTEGCKNNNSWNHLDDNSSLIMEVSSADFDNLLGFLNPTIEDDVFISANNQIISNSGEVEGLYPDINKNPMYPATEGNYTGDDIYSGNYLYNIGGYKWSVHPDIKWIYGTTPVTGNYYQNNPDTFQTDVTQIKDFTSTKPLTIPDDEMELEGNNKWTLVSGFVHIWEYISDIWEDQGEYNCYYNDVEHLIIEYVNDANTQINKIIELGNFTNSIDSSQVASDDSFYISNSDINTGIDVAISYHNNFVPVTPTIGRDTYIKTNMNTLISEASSFHPKIATRITEIDSLLGISTTDTTSVGYGSSIYNPPINGYSKEIYDACNTATHKEIGYIRKSISILKTEDDIKDIIDKKQNIYDLYGS